MIEVNEGPGVLDPSLLSQYLYNDFVQPISIPVWEARPCNYPPTCRVDKVLLDLVQSRKSLNLIGANEYEFTNDKFPSAAVLLNPQDHASTFPLTTTIVSVRHWSTLLTLALTQVFIETHYRSTIENLPEQVSLVQGIVLTVLLTEVDGYDVVRQTSLFLCP